jgi:hypothetical protein
VQLSANARPPTLHTERDTVRLRPADAISKAQFLVDAIERKLG